MKNQTTLLKEDIAIQKILFFFVCLSAFLPWFLMLTLPALGAWQLFSALVFRKKIYAEKRTRYIVGSTTYIGLMWTIYHVDFLFGYSDFLLGLVFILIPICIAIWYFLLTKSTLKELEDVIFIPDSMRDILDSEEIFKPIEE